MKPHNSNNQLSISLLTGGGNLNELNSKPKSKRYFGLDMIRVFASLFTIASHFIGFNTEFNSAVGFADPSLFLQGMGRMFFKGTPFFMLLSGFLLINKPFDENYFKRGKRVIVAYILFSIITLLFRHYWLGQDVTIWSGLHDILSFSAIPYSWYIEMWIGLFLLSPYINILFHSIPTRRKKELLISIVFALTCIPSLTNRYGLHLLPDFWSECYPLFYYLMGAYIKEYQPTVNRCAIVFIVVLICAINPTFTAIFAPTHTLVQIAGGSPSEAGSAIVGVLVFLLFYRYDIRDGLLKRVTAHIANLTLSIYLLSWIFDRLWYPWFMSHFFINQSQFGKWFFVVVPTIFISSLLAAQIKEWLFEFVGQIRKIK